MSLKMLEVVSSMRLVFGASFPLSFFSIGAEHTRGGAILISTKPLFPEAAISVWAVSDPSLKQSRQVKCIFFQDRHVKNSSLFRVNLGTFAGVVGVGRDMQP